MALVDPALNRQKFDGRDPEPRQMGDGGGMGETCECAANGFGDTGMAPRKAAHMHFINDEIAPRGGRALRRGGKFAGLDDRFRDEGGAVRIIFRLAIDARVEQAGVELERAVESCRVRIDEELRDVEAQATRGVERALRPQAIKRAGANARDMRVEDVAGAATQTDAGGLAVSFVEQGEEDRFGVAGSDGDVDAAIGQRNAERLGNSPADGEGLRGAQVITDGAARPVKCLIPASSFDSAMRSLSAAAVSICWRTGSGSKRSI